MTDVRDTSQVKVIFKQVSEVFGFRDTLVLNANASLAIAPFGDYQWQDFENQRLE